MHILLIAQRSTSSSLNKRVLNAQKRENPLDISPRSFEENFVKI
jgi:hypothetical protein